jgi:cytochrome b6-f complex iron-sulfur subunit
VLVSVVPACDWFGQEDNVKKTKKGHPGGNPPGSKKRPEAPPGQADEIPTPRRRFLNRLWLLLVALGVVELALMLTYYFKPRKPSADVTDGETLLTTGNVADFKPGSVTAFPQGRFYLVRLEDGGFLALSRQCTHLGCTVPWDEKAGHFACPCHASVFDMTGSVIKSPAPRALDRFPITIENNVIRVDTGRRIRRNQFRDDQVIYAKSDRN